MRIRRTGRNSGPPACGWARFRTTCSWSATPGPATISLPLARAYDIFQQAYRTVSGLARTVRGPSMSAFPGKVLVDGIVDLAGERSSPCSSCRHEIRIGCAARSTPGSIRWQPGWTNCSRRSGKSAFLPAGRRRPVADDSHCAGRRVALGQARAQRPGGDRMSGPTADALYEVYALRYATHAERAARRTIWARTRMTMPRCRWTSMCG